MSNMTGEASFSSGNRVDGGILPPVGTSNPSNNSAQQQAPVKRKRNLPGTPDPEAEVIALSPKTLMATNRFVCEICNKGFQRDQNLQLHRRGHNLPWKLRQRTTKEIRKRVYICPEKSCVHNDPSRALGDLTGIKKHFCRKHGEKKWKCDKCSKRYAVQSDWKAHSKTCGTREYRCDCGTLFSRRDSFITHRAFCDALAEESARVSVGINSGGGHMQNNPLVGAAGAMAAHVMGAPNSPSMMRQLGAGSSALEAQFNTGSIFRHSFGNNTTGFNTRPRLSLWLGQGPHGGEQGALGGNVNPMDAAASGFFTQSPKTMLGLSEYDDSQGPKTLSSLLPMTSSNSGGMYSTLFPSGSMNNAGSSGLQQNEITDNYGSGASTWNADRGSAAARLSLSTSAGLTTSSSSGTNINETGNLAGTVNNSSAYGSQQQHAHSAQMSATALLQKAAQMGATASNSAFRGFGIPGSNSNSVGLGLSWQGSSPQEQQRAHGTTGMVIQNTHNSNLFMKGPLDHMASHEGGSNFPSSQPFSGSSRSAENAGLHDLMNSLSGASSGLMTGGSLSGIQSTFVENMDYSGNFTGLNMIHARTNMNNPMKENTIGEGLQQSLQRGSSSSSLSPSSSLSQQMMMQQGGSSNHTALLPGMGNPTRNEDGSGGDDGLTRDFLGVGGVVAAGGLHGRGFSQRGDHLAANFTSLGSSMDMPASFHSHRAENLSAHGKAWDAAT